MSKMFSTNITTTPGMSIYSLRELAKNHPKEFIHKVKDGAESGEFSFRDIKNINNLYAATRDISVPIDVVDSYTSRSITTAAFPILTGVLAIAGINEAYNAVETVGQELVTEMEDNKKVTTLVQLLAEDSNMSEVKEGRDFPEISASEESTTIRSLRNGRKLTITKEAIEENEIADIASRINQLGEIASDTIEEQTIRRVCDYDGSAASPSEPYVYRPNGVGTALYSASASTPGSRTPNGTRVTSNAFVDETDLEKARKRLASVKNNRGTRITVPKSDVKIFAPDAVVGNVLAVINSEYVPGVQNERSNFGPAGKFHIPAERIITSPKLDDLSGTAWYYGAFKKQFVRKWKLRFEFVSLGQDTQAYLDSRIAAQFRIAWDVEIGARDYVYVVQNIAGTDSPKDE